MAPNPQFTGYTEDEYLDNPYLGGSAVHAFGMEVRLVVADATKTVGAEVNRTIADATKTVGAEADRIVAFTKTAGVETLRQIVDRPKAVGMEVLRQVPGATKTVGMEVRRDRSLASWLCDVYLVDGYLEDPYLIERICAQSGVTVERFIKDRLRPLGMEVNRVVADVKKSLGVEVLRRVVDRPKPIGMEIDMLRAAPLGAQVRRVLYNTKRLRVLCDFASRGAETTGGTNAWGNSKGVGKNWTADTTYPGDFSPFNLNTDIEEQRWQSNDVKTAVLSCDTEVVQGVLVDTVAIRNHNLTSSAVVTLEASNDSGFSPVAQTIGITITKKDAYWIAPTFPTSQYRYWRLVISDPTNPNPRLTIGCVLFGLSVILSSEDLVDEIRRTDKHFADRVKTEGFTNVSNHRAVKRALALMFRSFSYTSGDYKALRGVFDTALTSLKCLWIPDPQDPARFAVFAKLNEVPDEAHKNTKVSDVVDFDVNPDESL